MKTPKIKIIVFHIFLKFHNLDIQKIFFLPSEQYSSWNCSIDNNFSGRRSVYHKYEDWFKQNIKFKLLWGKKKGGGQGRRFTGLSHFIIKKENEKVWRQLKLTFRIKDEGNLPGKIYGISNMWKKLVEMMEITICGILRIMQTIIENAEFRIFTDFINP